MPHGRVKHLDLSAALAMPGVKGILTEDDLPAPADSLTDNGTVIRANKLGERGLTNEPLYQGEPILAVAAVDELTAAEAIEKIKIEFERLPSRSILSRPCAPVGRTQGWEAIRGTVHLRPRRSSRASGRSAADRG